MKRVDCLFERVSHIGVGVALLFIALGFTLIGVTVLPVVGLLPAIPFFLISAFFFRAPASSECAL